MAFSAELTIGEKTYSVKRFLILSYKHRDNNGKPGKLFGWRIDVIIDALKDTIVTEWALFPSKLNDGSIKVYGADGSVMKTIEFKQSRCIAMLDELKPAISFASCELRIMGDELTVGGSAFKREQPLIL